MSNLITGAEIARRAKVIRDGGSEWKTDRKRELEIYQYAHDVWKGDDEDLKWKIFDINFKDEYEKYNLVNTYVEAWTIIQLIKEEIRPTIGGSDVILTPKYSDWMMRFYREVREKREKEYVKNNRPKYEYKE